MVARAGCARANYTSLTTHHPFTHFGGSLAVGHDVQRRRRSTPGREIHRTHPHTYKKKVSP